MPLCMPEFAHPAQYSRANRLHHLKLVQIDVLVPPVGVEVACLAHAKRESERGREGLAQDLTIYSTTMPTTLMRTSVKYH